LSHQPRKRFGQNFLNDELVIGRIIESINPAATDSVVEVGPGLGALTLPLLERLNTLHVIEIDRDLSAKLAKRNLSALNIHEQDVLEIDWQDFVNTLFHDDADQGSQIRVVGNLPYNIGTPLLLKLLHAHNCIRDIHVMLQKEVVNRLCALVGTRAYGRLSVMMQAGFSVTHLFDVPAQAFSPPPKVESAVVRLVPRSNAPTKNSLETLSNASRIAFANKRKTLRNNFKGVLSAEELESCGIDPGARAETLSLQQFMLLAEMLP